MMKCEGLRSVLYYGKCASNDIEVKIKFVVHERLNVALRTVHVLMLGQMRGHEWRCCAER